MNDSIAVMTSERPPAPASASKSSDFPNGLGLQK